MRSMSTLQDKVIPYLSDLLYQLTQRLTAAAKNPSKPNYNHYLFESITLAVRIVCKQNPEAVTTFEQTLFPIFQIIIQQVGN